MKLWVVEPKLMKKTVDEHWDKVFQPNQNHAILRECITLYGYKFPCNRDVPPSTLCQHYNWIYQGFQQTKLCFDGERDARIRIDD